MARDMGFDPGDLRYRLTVKTRTSTSASGDVLRGGGVAGVIDAWVRPLSPSKSDEVIGGVNAPVESSSHYKLIWRASASPQPAVSDYVSTPEHGEMQIVSISVFDRFGDYRAAVAEAI